MTRNLGLHSLLIALIVALGAGAALWGQHKTERLQEQVLVLRRDAEEAQRLLATVGELDATFRGYLLYNQAAYVAPVHAALARMRLPEVEAILRTMDTQRPVAQPTALRQLVLTWLEQRERAMQLMLGGEREQVLATGATGRTQDMTNELRRRVYAYLDVNGADVLRLKSQLSSSSRITNALVASSALVSLVGLLLAYVLLRRQQQAEKQAQAGLARSSQEMTSLLHVSDMLQSSSSVEDVAAVIARAAGPLLSGHGGALYLRTEAEDGALLHREADWGEGGAMPQLIQEGGCWSLKRGREQDCGADTPCEARGCGGGALCLPLSARGEELGILRVAGLRRGERSAQLALALADGISLAVSNISLREKLRAQALRDPLTGLYNRRFLEEVGDKIAAQVQRRQGQLSVLMLDLDHFKALNDRHGHAVGDAALRHMGEVLGQGLRRTDVACRYGGEEFVLLLPDCPPEAAMERAEAICRRVERHSGARGAPAVTVSIGVASLPDSAGTLLDTLRAADEALYAAKAAGRNRAVLAAPRAAPAPLRLAMA